MNYKAIYDNLIKRASSRIIDSLAYYETHHIIPKCLGGSNDVTNLVKLTAREHYIAHLCLIKIYPGNAKLVKAAVMMCCNSNTTKRSGNRIYEWLRKKHSVAMSISQTGSGNSQFGKKWIYSDSLKTCKKVSYDDIDEYLKNGWKIGRVLNFSKMYQTCCICLTKFRHPHKRKTCGDICEAKLTRTGQVYYGREQEFLDYYHRYKSMNKALKSMGFPGAVARYYQWAKSILEKNI